jgi:hypothetical protein
MRDKGFEPVMHGHRNRDIYKKTGVGVYRALNDAEQETDGMSSAGSASCIFVAR